MFGDILMWALTFFGLVPWDKMFGRKKDFHEQLAELNDGHNPFRSDISCDDVPAGASLTDEEAEYNRLATDPETGQRVRPYICPVRKRL